MQHINLDNDFAPAFLGNIYHNRTLPPWHSIHGSLSMLSKKLFVMVYEMNYPNGTFTQTPQPLPSLHLKALGENKSADLDGLCKITCTPSSIVMGMDHHIPAKQKGLCTGETISLLGQALHKIANEVLYTNIRVNEGDNVFRLDFPNQI